MSKISIDTKLVNDFLKASGYKPELTHGVEIRWVKNGAGRNTETALVHELNKLTRERFTENNWE